MCVYLLIYLPVTSNVRTKYFEHKIFNDKIIFMTSLWLIYMCINSMFF